MNAGPFLWGTRTDLAVFGGSAAVAVLLVAIGHATGWSDAPVPGWMWIALVLAIDVGHVWSTLARTYLDREELARRRGLYIALPIVCWAAGVALYRSSALWFWRALAYLALFHFVRQQVGWVAIYRARGGNRSRTARIVDEAAVYAATLYPVLVWHAKMPRQFDWFVTGDFVAIPALRPWLSLLGGAYAICLLAFASHQLIRAVRTRTIEVGKCVVVGSTTLTWWLGIAATNSDFDFTATNVIVHGVPYMYLLWRYAKANARLTPHIVASKLVRAGALAFVTALLLLAFAEEALWDRLVWHDHEWLFGGMDDDRFELGAKAAALVVPLLGLPQATHYALDALLWRSKDKNPAQAQALGFA